MLVVLLPFAKTTMFEVSLIRKHVTYLHSCVKQPLFKSTIFKVWPCDLLIVVVKLILIEFNYKSVKLKLNIQRDYRYSRYKYSFIVFDSKIYSHSLVHVN